MKTTAFLFLGVVLGLIAGYWLHSTLSAPLGSNITEYRVLSQDVDIAKEYFLGPNQPPLLGTLKKGSKFAVTWRKSDAVYIEFYTVVPEKRLQEISVEEKRR